MYIHIEIYRCGDHRPHRVEATLLGAAQLDPTPSNEIYTFKFDVLNVNTYNIRTTLSLLLKSCYSRWDYGGSQGVGVVTNSNWFDRALLSTPDVFKP